MWDAAHVSRKKGQGFHQTADAVSSDLAMACNALLLA